MLRTFFLSLLLLCAIPSFSQKSELTVVSYNCENLFDCRHDTLKEDQEFLPEAERHWTRGRYWKKVNDIGRVILSCGGVPSSARLSTKGAQEGKDWRLPDIVGLVEVENDSVLLRLIRGSVLREAGYRYVMTHSEDRRGVDVALLYNPFTIRLLSSDTLRVQPKEGQRPTRDVLHATVELRSEDTLHVFVVHAPSRSGGQGLTDNYRLAVMKRIMMRVDSLRSTDSDAKVMLCGDFNDYSYNKSLKYLKANGLTDVSEKAVGIHHPDEVLGTYYYQRVWESLDHIFLSEPLMRHVADHDACFIQDKDWILEKTKQGKLKPYRTYLGTFYHGGVSDHLPLVLHLSFHSQEK